MGRSFAGAPAHSYAEHLPPGDEVEHQCVMGLPNGSRLSCGRNSVLRKEAGPLTPVSSKRLLGGMRSRAPPWSPQPNGAAVSMGTTLKPNVGVRRRSDGHGGRGVMKMRRHRVKT